MLENRIKNLIDEMTLMDDQLFRTAFTSDPERIRVILDPVLNRLGIFDYKIKQVLEQKHLTSLLHKETIIDLVVELKSGEKIMVEVQNSNFQKMSPKRIRYEESMLDTHSLRKGQDYEELCPRITIILSTKNLLQNDRAFNLIRRVNLEDQNIYDDETFLVFLSDSLNDEDNSDIVQLIQDMKEEDISKVKHHMIREIYDFKNSLKGQTMFRENFQKLIDEETEKIRRESEEVRKEDQKIIRKLKDELNLAFKKIHQLNLKIKHLEQTGGV